MNKTEKIEEKICDVLMKDWTISEKEIIRSADMLIYSLPNLKESVSNLLNAIRNNEIEYLSVEGDTKEAEEYLLTLFPIGLYQLDPIDYEGKDPNTIIEMFKNASFYMLYNIKKNNIKNIKFLL